MGRLAVLVLMIPSLCAQTSFPPCDVNQDGVVNIVDVQLMIDEALGLSSCTDPNIDGSCDISALQRVINAALGQPCDAIVTTGLVGYWKLDESSGTVVHDSSGFGYNGMVTSPPGDWSWDATGGKVNGAFIKYSGNNPITIPSNSQINFTTDFSITLWIKAAAGVQNIVWKATTLGFEGYGIGLNGNGSQLIAYLDNTMTLGNALVPSNQWAHIAVTKSGPTLNFYINGVADTPFTVPATITATTAPLILGIGGYTDDVHLYNRALSATEVQAIMASNGAYAGATQTAPPIISSFTASPSPVNPGQSVTLAWTVSGASAVSIDNGVGAQTALTNGSIAVSPAASTTYTLTATNSGGSSTAIATAVVNIPPIQPATNVIITSPSANSVLSGNANLAVSITGLAGVASVKYFVNQREIYNAGDPVGPIASPYSYSWNTNNVWDSWSQLTAQGLDSSGNVLSTSAPVPIQIANGSYTLAQATPVAGQTLTGVIAWNEVMSSNAPSSSLTQCYVDGVEVLTGNGSFLYDTTQLPNGQHELHCVIAPPNTSTGNGYQTPVAMSSNFFYVDNGQTPMQLRANYKILWMTPGQTQNLTAQLVYTNGAEAPVSPSFYVDNASIATVTPTGTVTAQADGIANITVAANGKSTTVQVIVNDSSLLPHFSNAGAMLTTYDAGSSLFVRTLFSGPTPDYDFDAAKSGDPNLVQEVNAAAINALTLGIYSNPADLSGWNPNNYSNQANTFASFQALWDATNAQRMSYLTANGWSVLLTGDDIARTVNEMIDSIFDPYSTQKIQYVLQYWKNSGTALGIEMIDEADGAWGCNPLASTAGYWNPWSPLFVTSPFSALEPILDGVPRPYIAWPTIGIGAAVCLQNWQGNPSFADYTSLYWDRLWDVDPYPDGMSNYEMTSSFETKYAASLPVMQRNKPLLVLVGFSGPSWNKNVTGTGFVPGVDSLIHPAWTPAQVSEQIFLDIAKGAAGVRLYQFEHAYQAATVWPAGTQFVQEGTSPQVGVPRWAAMSAAFNLVKSIEPYALSPMTNAIDLGPYVETGAHSGPSGNLLIAINTLDNPQTIQADLGPYVTGSAVTRYRLAGSAFSSQSLGVVTSDQVTLNPGEVTVYVFPSQ